jgi:uncharacterized protein (DUF1330 family)
MAAYVITVIEITDPEGFARYREMVVGTIDPFGGRYIARGGAITTLEGDWHPERVVIAEFPNAEQARAWWDSPAYAAAKAQRQESSRTQMIIVEGV